MNLLPAEAGQRLIDFYLAFQPRNCFQGLPPLKDAVCVDWVRDMLRSGLNVIAVQESSDVAVIGHAALFPIDAQTCEMLVVVGPGFQNVGIGTQLVQCCVRLAREMGFERIWLPVDATNVRARHVYCKCGFERLSNSQEREIDMSCDVRRQCIATAGVPPLTAPHWPAVDQPSRSLFD